MHDEIVAFFHYISPSPEEAHARAMVIAKVSSLVTRRFPQGAVDTFGSVAQNLYLPDGCVPLRSSTHLYRMTERAQGHGHGGDDAATVRRP